MYLEHFHLQELPFRLSPDPEFLYLSKNHSRAKAYMESTIWFTDGFVVITGEIGSGKTTLIESFLREVDKDIVVAQINQTQITAIEFLQSVLVQFGFTPFKMRKAELLATFNQFLTEQYAAGRKVLLIIDEAQNLAPRVLEEVRMLSGVETTKEKVLRIILAGQPELNEKLDAPELIQLAQRVRLRFHLTALSQSDMEKYVKHRLEVAGAAGREIFTADTFEKIFRYTGGTPRLINTLCDTALLATFAASKQTVDMELIDSAIEELQWVEYNARTHNQRKPKFDMKKTPDSDPNAPVIARMILTSEGQYIADLKLRPGRKILGRTTDNDLQIESRFVSRHHCQIISSEAGCVIEDLNSTNGIYVKRRRVRRHSLNDGDVVTIGTHDLTYVDERHLKPRSMSDTMPAAQTVVLSSEVEH
jgi:type II secretory pathway predicted ATPase ExeA